MRVFTVLQADQGLFSQFKTTYVEKTTKTAEKVIEVLHENNLLKLTQDSPRSHLFWPSSLPVRVKDGMSLRNGMWHGLRNDIIMRNLIYPAE